MHQKKVKKQNGGPTNLLKATGIMERPPASEDEKHGGFALLKKLYDALGCFLELEAATENCDSLLLSSRIDAQIIRS